MTGAKAGKVQPPVGEKDTAPGNVGVHEKLATPLVKGPVIFVVEPPLNRSVRSQVDSPGKAFNTEMLTFCVTPTGPFVKLVAAVAAGAVATARPVRPSAAAAMNRAVIPARDRTVFIGDPFREEMVFLRLTQLGDRSRSTRGEMRPLG